MSCSNYYQPNKRFCEHSKIFQECLLCYDQQIRVSKKTTDFITMLQLLVVKFLHAYGLFLFKTRTFHKNNNISGVIYQGTSLLNFQKKILSVASWPPSFHFWSPEQAFQSPKVIHFYSSETARFLNTVLCKGQVLAHQAILEHINCSLRRVLKFVPLVWKSFECQAQKLYEN